MPHAVGFPDVLWKGADPAVMPRLARRPGPTCNFLYVERGVRLKTMTYSESRARYAETLNSVVEYREEVIVTRRARPGRDRRAG